MRLCASSRQQIGRSIGGAKLGSWFTGTCLGDRAGTLRGKRSGYANSSSHGPTPRYRQRRHRPGTIMECAKTGIAVQCGMASCSLLASSSTRARACYVCCRRNKRLRRDTASRRDHRWLWHGGDPVIDRTCPPHSKTIEPAMLKSLPKYAGVLYK